MKLTDKTCHCAGLHTAPWERGIPPLAHVPQIMVRKLNLRLGIQISLAGLKITLRKITKINISEVYSRPHTWENSPLELHPGNAFLDINL